MQFLAIGECMAELAPMERPSEFRLGYAGDTFNTAWYLAQIAPNIHVSFATAVGDDVISQGMRAFMRNSHINDAFVQVIPGKTVGLYLIHLKDGERSFSYWRNSSAARQLAVDQAALEQSMVRADLIYFSGITLAILDPQSRQNLFSALGRARAAGKTIAFDTNLRPRLWDDTDEMIQTIMFAAAQSDIVLPSHEDEAVWFGDNSATETLDRYAKLGPGLVIVKNSADPVVFQHAGKRGEIHVEPAIDFVDTTAAGDSFNAGVFAEIMKSGDPVKGIKSGCRLAGQVVRKKGALVPIEPLEGVE
ncbi:sugar kinase [Yoonia sp. F2084L]|uniref:sugar kinase n=1 Tax=Yoonia sp. F2084L TaxID=2926419 RepID=UPI001FF14098|nr:sugar kinase [Yoonia sp. F2084L]MCK0096377.1 sugar kinase [Yoonia sp. F2084L]